MNKNTSQKPGGCKAAKSPFGPAPEGWLKNKGKDEILTLDQLRAERDRIDSLARDHAEAAALKYYGVPTGQDLSKFVFADFIDQHKYTEDFKPILFMRRN